MDWNKVKKGVNVVTKKSLDIAAEGIEATNKKILERKEQNRKGKEELKKRILKMDKEGILYCPKCYSTSISANKKGFGVGKAVAGFIIHPVGVTAGLIGRKKIECTCLKCGYKWKAGKK